MVAAILLSILINGQVVDGTTRAPVVGATVKIDDSSVRTGRDGRFSLENVGPGEHRIVTSKAGYVTDEQTVVVDEKNPVTDVTIRMTAAGVITGRIVDDEGRPVRGAPVEALAYGYTNGRRQLVTHGSPATTNDRGEFRLFWLNPGTYYIVANVPAVQQVAAANLLGYFPRNPSEAFATTYYPGTPDIDRAEAVQVVSGEIDVHAISLATLPSRRIRVRIQNDRVSQDHPVPIIATLRPSAEKPYVPSRRISTSRQAGSAEFSISAGAAAGSYSLTVLVPIQNLYVGRTEFAIGNSDSEIVLNMPVSGTLTVEGTLQFDGHGALRVNAIPDPSIPSDLQVSANATAQGKFRLENVLPIGYSIRIDGQPDDAYLDSVTLLDKEVRADHVEFPAGLSTVTMKVAVKSDGGRVNGVTKPGATVVLFPEAALRSRPERFKLAVANAAGEFLIRGIAPGAYSVLAFEQIEDGAYQDAGFLQQFDATATKITVAPSTEVTASPALIAAGRCPNGKCPDRQH